jgi:hypothetical protein
MGKADEGYVIFQAYKSSPFLEKSPLSKLLFFVFESIRIRNQECFSQIFDSFENTLKRDAEFEKLLKKVGNFYLGINYSAGFNIMSMVESLFK